METETTVKTNKKMVQKNHFRVNGRGQHIAQSLSDMASKQGSLRLGREQYFSEGIIIVFEIVDHKIWMKIGIIM